MEKILSFLNKEIEKLDLDINRLQNDKNLIKLSGLVKTYNTDIKGVDVNLLKNVLKLDLHLANKLNYIVSYYDLFMVISNEDNDVKDFFNNTINEIGRMLFSKYDDLRKNNNESLSLLIDKKRRLELLLSKLNLLQSGYSSILKSEIFDLIYDAPLYPKKKEEIIFSVNNWFFDSANEDKTIDDDNIVVNEDTFLIEEDVSTESLTNEYEEIFDDKNCEIRDEFYSLQNEIKNILNDNIVYTDEIYNICEKYHIEFKMFKTYLNKGDFDNLIGLFEDDVSILYLDFIKSLYDLKDCLSFDVNGDLDLSIMFINDAIESYKYSKEIYLNSCSISEISTFDKFISSSQTILLFAKNNKGEYTIDSTIKTGDSNQISSKEQAIFETIKTFSSIPYMSDNFSDNCEMSFAGSRDKKARGRIAVIYKNNPIKSDKKKILDDEFGTSYKRYRTNNYPRVSYVVLPICKTNRKKLAEFFGNLDLIHTTSVVVIVGSCYVTSGHDEYNILNETLDISREYIRYLKKIFADPDTDIKVLSDIVNESMKYAFDYFEQNFMKKR